MLTSGKESYDQPRQHIKKQRHYFANKGLSSLSYGFFSSHIWMWELDYKESWVPKNWCFRTAALEKTLESPLGCKEIQPVHPKGDQSWVFIGRTDVEAETPILWPPDANSWLIGKDPDARKDWGQRMRWLDGITDSMDMSLGRLRVVGDGQGGLACCGSWGYKELDETEQLNWTESPNILAQAILQESLNKLYAWLITITLFVLKTDSNSFPTVWWYLPYVNPFLLLICFVPILL